MVTPFIYIHSLFFGYSFHINSFLYSFLIHKFLFHWLLLSYTFIPCFSVSSRIRCNSSSIAFFLSHIFNPCFFMPSFTYSFIHSFLLHPSLHVYGFRVLVMHSFFTNSFIPCLLYYYFLSFKN